MKIQNKQEVAEYDYGSYDRRFYHTLPKIKCPACGSKDLSFYFCTDRTIISCQNTKRQKTADGAYKYICPAIGQYVFETHHLLDDRFGEITRKLVPFHFRSPAELMVMEG